MSIESVDDKTLNDCFTDGDLNKVFGSKIQTLFIKKISQAESNLHRNFVKLCSDYAIEDLLKGE